MKNYSKGHNLLLLAYNHSNPSVKSSKSSKYATMPINTPKDAELKIEKSVIYEIFLKLNIFESLAKNCSKRRIFSVFLESSTK